jgi:hypothetical protein
MQPIRRQFFWVVLRAVSPSGGRSTIIGHAAYVFTVLALFRIWIFMTSPVTVKTENVMSLAVRNYRRCSTWTSTSHGRSVPFF